MKVKQFSLLTSLLWTSDGSVDMRNAVEEGGRG